MEGTPPDFQGVGFSHGQSVHEANHVGPWSWPAYKPCAVEEQQSVS